MTKYRGKTVDLSGSKWTWDLRPLELGPYEEQYLRARALLAEQLGLALDKAVFEALGVAASLLGTEGSTVQDTLNVGDCPQKE